MLHNQTFKKLITPALGMIMVCASFLAFTGCEKSEEVSLEQKTDYSGEALFRGLFFFQGDVPTKVQSLRPHYDQFKQASRDKKVDKAMQEFIDEMIVQIKQIDPTYFDQFKAQIQSDNMYGIELAIANGTKMIEAAGYRSEKYAGMFKLQHALEVKKVDFSKAEFQNLDLKTAEGVEKFKKILKKDYLIDLDDEQYKVACAPFGAVCVVILVAAVYNTAAAIHTAAAAVNAVAVVAAYLKVGLWGGFNAEMTGTAYDQLISEIAQTF
jgi:hypothetical protein